MNNKEVKSIGLSQIFEQVKLILKSLWETICEAAKKVFEVAKMVYEKAKEFAKENPELAAAIATVTIPTIVSGAKSISNAIADAIDDRHRRLQSYDRRTDEYLNLRRELNNREQEELALRMNCGESKTMILRDMGLLR